MKALKLYGASDDLIEMEFDGKMEFGGKDDEFNVYGETHMGYVIVRDEGAQIRIHCIYDGSWCFAIASRTGLNNDVMPEWAVRRTWGQDTPYSETLEMDLPNDATVEFKKSRTSG